MLSRADAQGAGDADGELVTLSSTRVTLGGLTLGKSGEIAMVS